MFFDIWNIVGKILGWQTNHSAFSSSKQILLFNIKFDIFIPYSTFLSVYICKAEIDCDSCLQITTCPDSVWSDTPFVEPVCKEIKSRRDYPPVEALHTVTIQTVV